MRQQLIRKFLAHVRENHPDILFDLGDNEALMQWMNDRLIEVSGIIQQMKKTYKPDGKIISACMEELTQNLLPSRYNYIRDILQDEFEEDYSRFVRLGILQFEAVNMVIYCRSTFDDLRFSVENEDNRFTRYAITGLIKDYLQENSVNEAVNDVLQQSKEIQG